MSTNIRANDIRELSMDDLSAVTGGSIIREILTVIATYVVEKALNSGPMIDLAKLQKDAAGHKGWPK